MNATRQTMPISRPYPMACTRNIGIAAHVDAGKTTLTERILFYTGVIHQPGEVHDGNTMMDFDPIEVQKGITIAAAAISTAWTRSGRLAPEESAPCRINLIDTPGHVDFTAEVERSLRVLDGVIAVFSAVEGVQPQSETVWRQAETYRVPRLAFINKMDRTGANFARVLAELRNKLRANAWPVVIPIGQEVELRGQVDVIGLRAVVYHPDDRFGLQPSFEPLEGEMLALAETARRGVIGALAEIDSAMADIYLAEREPTAAELRSAIRRQTIANCFLPVIGGSAFKYVGVQALLDGVLDYLPSPLDLPSLTGHDPETGAELEARCGDDQPLRALVFKSCTDGFSRRRIFVRVYSGVLHPGDFVLNAATGRRERISRISEMRADQELSVPAAFAGDIVVVAGLKEVATGQTLCAEEAPILLEPPSFPEPVVSMAIEPETRTDQERLGFVLQRLAEDDPTFRVTTHPETGQTLIAGMGELHLEVIRERMLTTFKVATRAGAPEIAYRETISIPARGEGRQVKRNGGVGQHGHVIVEIAPRERGFGLSIVDKVVGGAIPRQFIAAAKKGIIAAAESGVLAGYPVVDLLVEIVDGSYHMKDSSDLDFQIAGSLALKDAVAKAKPLLLEPIMLVECTAPRDCQGDLIGDLQRRRAVVREITGSDIAVVIKAEAPLAEMFGYANAIRSLSKGRAQYAMTPSRFEIAPAALVARKCSAA